MMMLRVVHNIFENLGGNEAMSVMVLINARMVYGDAGIVDDRTTKY